MITNAGKIRFLKQIKSPWRARITAERFDRNQWNVVGLDRTIPDLCADMQLPTNPLYTFFSQFKRKSCPFPEGHVETFEHGKVTEVPNTVPDDFEGRYRAILRFQYREGLSVLEECSLINFDLVDVS
jgi:hypothetical protein